MPLQNSPFEAFDHAIGTLDRERLADSVQALRASFTTEEEHALLRERLSQALVSVAAMDLDAMMESMHSHGIQRVNVGECEARSLGLVTDLLAAGADPHGGNVHPTEQPVVGALSNKNWPMVLVLIKAGANPLSEIDQESRSVRTDMFEAPTAVTLELLDLMDSALFHKNIVMSLMKSKGWKDDDLAVVSQRLVDKGFPIPTDGMTLLHLAGMGHARTMGMLLNAGADPAFSTTMEIQTHFPVAAPASGTPHDAAAPSRFAFRRPVALQTHVHTGYTALHHAAFRGQANTVRRLLEGGAPLNAVTDEGVNPLHLAAYVGTSVAAVRALMDAGLSMEQTDHHGRNTMDWTKKGPAAHEVQEYLALQQAANGISISPETKPNRPRL